MAETARKKAHILSSFNDIGTGQRFTAGDTPMIDAGAYANYEAAGLVGAPPPTRSAPTKAKAKSRRKVAARTAAPRSTPPAAIPPAGMPEDSAPSA